MSAPALRLVHDDAGSHADADAAWMDWLVSRADQQWRPGEWVQALWLFTGDLDGDRTAAWLCGTPGCGTATNRHNGRCDSCKREQADRGVSQDAFDAEPRRRRTRPVARGACSVPGCEGDLLCRGLCFRHERAWRRAGEQSVEEFIAQARPLARLKPCAVGGCGREAITTRRLCKFHDQRLRREHRLSSVTVAELAAWVASEPPRLGAHQFCLAGLTELVRYELLYALQCRDASPPPLDPMQVRILARRLEATDSMRNAEPRGDLRERRDAIQLGHPGPVPRPVPPPGSGMVPAHRGGPLRR